MAGGFTVPQIRGGGRQEPLGTACHSLKNVSFCLSESRLPVPCGCDNVNLIRAAIREITIAIYRLLQKEAAFDQEAIEAMHSAFKQVCTELGLDPKKDRAAEIVAMKIIEGSKAGERNPATMRLSALFALRLMRDDPQQ